MPAKGYVQVNKPANRAEKNRYSAWERRQKKVKSDRELKVSSLSPAPKG